MPLRYRRGGGWNIHRLCTKYSEMQISKQLSKFNLSWGWNGREKATYLKDTHKDKIHPPLFKNSLGAF